MLMYGESVPGAIGRLASEPTSDLDSRQPSTKGELLNVPPDQAQTPPAAAQPAEGYAVKWPLARVIGFTILSLGIYQFYWFYITRKWITQQIGGNDNVGLQTLGLIVPILNFVIIYWLWRDISALRERVGLSPMNVSVYVIVYILGALFLPLVNVVILVLVLQALNEYWDASTNGQAVDKPTTSGELMATFIPLVVIVLVIVVAVAAG